MAALSFLADTTWTPEQMSLLANGQTNSPVVGRDWKVILGDNQADDN